METIRQHLRGQWQEGEGTREIRRVNPARVQEGIAQGREASLGQVDQAVVAAREAYPAWRRTPAPRRGEILFRAAEILTRRKEELGRLVTREMGKILSEGLGDIQEAIDMAYYMGGEGRRLSGETVPSELPDKDARSIRVPIGVFALITPWNFPMAIPAWKVFPALVAGNTAVLKPSPESPLCAMRLVEILEEAGLPPGVLNLVHGDAEVGEYLATHPQVDAVSFTGSCAVGKHLEARCGALHRRIAVEMGGKNAILVMEDADLDLAVYGALWGGFGTTGQRCTAASRIIVHQSVYEDFLSRFVDAASRLRLGPGEDPSTQMGPLVSETQFQQVLEYIRIGQEEGAPLVLGGRPYREGACKDGWFIEPTIFAPVNPRMRIAQEEIFGPVVCVIPARDLEEAIAIANDTPYGLSASIYTRDVRNTAIAEQELETGLVYINAPTIGAEVQLPFGGIKDSGLGHPEAGGRGGALEVYTRWKVIYRDFSGRLQRAQIDR